MNNHDNKKRVQILERILCSQRSTQEKKLLALIGLVSLARRIGATA